MLRFANEAEMPPRLRAQIRRADDQKVERAIAKLERTPARSRLEDMAERAVIAHGFPAPEREYRFIEDRMFRFDLAWPTEKIAIEVQGGTWTGGRHVRGTGYEMDCRKMTAAQVLGWTILYVTERMIQRGEMAAALDALFGRLAPSLSVARIFPPGPRGRVRYGDALRLVLAALDGGPTMRELVERSGLHPQTALSAVRKGRSTGVIVRTGEPRRFRHWRAGEGA